MKKKLQENGLAIAIETYYKGKRFRSRLEAKWAVFMDELGVDWEFEPQGYRYKLHNGSEYLPDFFLPNLDCLLEIKPRKPSRDEIDKAWVAVEATGKDLFILWGEPQDPSNVSYSDKEGCIGLFRDNRCPKELDGYEEWIVSDDRYWAKCSACGRVGIVLMGATEKLNCCPNNPGHSLSPVDNGEISKAAKKARNFRFSAVA